MAADPQVVMDTVGPLFQEAYQVIYAGGKFQVMLEQAQTDGDPVNAVAQLTSSIVNSTIKDAGVKDMTVLYSLAVLLISDLLEGLEQAGIQSQEGQMEAIISTVIQNVLASNPAFAQEVLQSPEMQELQASVDGQGGAVEAVAEEAGVPVQGVLEGIQDGV